MLKGKCRRSGRTDYYRKVNAVTLGGREMLKGKCCHSGRTDYAERKMLSLWEDGKCLKENAVALGGRIIAER